MKRFGKQQEGLTFISLLLVLAVIGFFAYIAIKLTSPFTWNISASVRPSKSLAEEESQGLRSARLKSRLMKRLAINAVTHVSGSDISISSEAKSKTVTVQYDGDRCRFIAMSACWSLSIDSVTM